MNGLRVHLLRTHFGEALIGACNTPKDGGSASGHDDTGFQSPYDGGGHGVKPDVFVILYLSLVPHPTSETPEFSGVLGYWAQITIRGSWADTKSDLRLYLQGEIPQEGSWSLEKREVNAAYRAAYEEIRRGWPGRLAGLCQQPGEQWSTTKWTTVAEKDVPATALATLDFGATTLRGLFGQGIPHDLLRRWEEKKAK